VSSFIGRHPPLWIARPAGCLLTHGMTPQEFQKLAQAAAEPARKEFHSAYRNWLERLATLSTTALALLVSLQKSYVPTSPKGGWLLAASWCLLCAATLCAALALYGEARVHLEFLRRLQRLLGEVAPEIHRMSVPQLQDRVGYGYNRPKFYFAAAATSALAFAAALVALTAYAVLNLS
jgi:hypothetical protein